MGRKDDIRRMGESLDMLGLNRLDDLLKENLARMKPGEETTAAMADALAAYAVEERERRAEALIQRARLPGLAYLDDFWDYSARIVDRELLRDAVELHFLADHRNMVIWGGSGTGKTWAGSMIATSACKSFYRTKWVEFPFLMRDLRQKASKGGTALDSRLGYYCGFDLLCIDVFMSMDVEEEMSRNDVYLFQELVNKRHSQKKSMLVIVQCDPYKLDSFVKPKNAAQSIKGRLLGKATVISKSGPDLRLYDPSNENPIGN